MAEDIAVIEAREKTNDKEYFKAVVETNPLLIEWANEEIRDDKEIILFQDFERLTESKYGIELVQNLEKENNINYVDIERIPKTLILCEKNQEYFAYLTVISRVFSARYTAFCSSDIPSQAGLSNVVV